MRWHEPKVGHRLIAEFIPEYELNTTLDRVARLAALRRRLAAHNRSIARGMRGKSVGISIRSLEFLINPNN